MRSTTLRRILVAAVLGLLITVGTIAAQQDLAWSLALGALVAGVAAIIGFLIEFESRLTGLETRAPLTRLPDDAQVPRVLRDLVEQERRRVDTLLQDAAAGREITYDGEDREWLLTLTNAAQGSIDAVSHSPVPSSTAGHHEGFTATDLHQRYLELQRKAVNRGVRIRRLFVFDTPGSDEELFRIADQQSRLGVNVRVLNGAQLPEHLRSLLVDFVVFDDALTYEITPATSLNPGSEPGLVVTRLTLTDARVQDRRRRFEQLWEAAQAPDRTSGTEDRPQA